MTARQVPGGAALRVVRFSNPFSQELGLRFRHARPDTLYLFPFGREVRLTFSMWFVFTQIDVYFLDKARRVVDRKLSFRPFTAYAPRKPYWYAIETAPGVRSWRVGERVDIPLE